MEIEEKDRSTLITRIQGVYRKAVIRLGIIVKSGTSYSSYSITDSCSPSLSVSSSWLTRGQTVLESNPESRVGSQSIKVKFLVSCLLVDLLTDAFLSYLLTFAYAEAQKIKKEFAGVHATYDKYLTLLLSHLETIVSSQKYFIIRCYVPTSSTGKGVVNNNNHTTATTEAGIQSVNSSFNTQASEEKSSKNAELQRLRTEYVVN